jgi:transcriptional regulator with XRE-family HTH domain
MNFSYKLKSLRKQFKLSQEQLAEKLNVSRQAITKWETEGGMPDIENLMRVSALFSIAMDDLLSNEKLAHTTSDYTHKSVTEYDICGLSHFDINAPGAQEICISVSENEKLRVCLASNILKTVDQDYKVKLDEHRNRIDVDIHRVGKISEAEGKEALYIHIVLPIKFCKEVELAAIADCLRLIGFDFPFEFDGKTSNVILENVKGKVVLNCNTDMVIYADEMPNAIEINQINATSVLHIPMKVKYFTKIKGKSNIIRYMVDGKLTEALSIKDAENYVEIAGMNVELLIVHGSK